MIKQQNSIFEKIQTEIKNTKQLCYVKNSEDAIHNKDSSFIWIGTKDGLIGNEKCHYEFIFQNNKELSLEVHFCKSYNRYLLKGSFKKKLEQSSIQIEDWSDDNGTKRFIYRSLPRNEEMIERKAINLVIELNNILGKYIINCIKQNDSLLPANILSSKDGKPSTEKRITHKKIAVRNSSYTCPHHQVEMDLIHALKKKHKIHSNDVIRYERKLLSIKPDVFEYKNNQYIIYEVKPYESPVDCIQEALGQVLFYSYIFDTNVPKYKVKKLFIVGPNPKTEETDDFINYIKLKYGLKGIDYICPNDIK